MAPPTQDIEIDAKVLQRSSGLALDIGGSVAKIVYRCKESYKNGVPTDSKASEDVGCLKMVSFPREAVEEYLTYIAEHADLAGDLVTVNSCGLGGLDYKHLIESRLNVKLNNLTEFACVSKALLGILTTPSGGEFSHRLDEEGIREGMVKFHTAITFQFMADGKPAPSFTEFQPMMQEAVDKVKGMMEGDIRLPCLVAMCGSAFPLMVLREDGSFDCVDVTLFAGRCFLGLASITTGVRDWAKIQEMVATHDGKTTFPARPTETPPPGSHQEEAHTEKPDDPYASTAGMQLFPFGNGNTVPRESLRDGDILHTLFDLVSENVGTLAFNTALAHGIRQVLFCGGFCEVPQARTTITREILWRNMRAHLTKDFERIVDFRFIKNGAHLGALGAYVHQEPK